MILFLGTEYSSWFDSKLCNTKWYKVLWYHMSLITHHHCHQSLKWANNSSFYLFSHSIECCRKENIENCHRIADAEGKLTSIFCRKIFCFEFIVSIVIDHTASMQCVVKYGRCINKCVRPDCERSKFFKTWFSQENSFYLFNFSYYFWLTACAHQYDVENCRRNAKGKLNRSSLFATKISILWNTLIELIKN